MIHDGHCSASMSALLIAMLTGVGVDGAACATLSVDPDLVYLGSFSTVNPMDSDLRSGITSVRIDSPMDWRLQVTVADRLRRITDGLELPVDRVREIQPNVPGEILDGGPYIATDGHGSEDPRVIQIDWGILDDALRTYLREGDPAGEYETTLNAVLLDRTSDSVLAGPASLVIEFEIQRWARFPDGIANVEIRVDASQAGSFVGDPAVVMAEANTRWVLSLVADEDLIRDDGGAVIPLDSLSVCVLDGNGFGSWVPLQRDCVPLGPNPVPLAQGAEPPPFTLEVQGVPIVLRLICRTLPPAGRYGTTLSFSLVTNALPED